MRARRSAYTLLELLLVVAIIVVVAALSYPTIEGTFGALRVKAASDAVRTAWAQARTRAIDDARPYRFAIVPGKGNFRVAPDSQDFWNGSDTSATADSPSPPLVLEGSLPRGIRFLSADAPDDAGVPDAGAAMDPVNSSDWTRVATFLPDGTATDDVEVRFQSGGGKPIGLRLRGLTGSVTSSKPASESP